MTRMPRRPVALGLLCLVAMLAGCSFAPDSAAVETAAGEVFDELVAEMSAADPGVIRTVEVLPEESRDCGTGTQRGLFVRGTLAVGAEDAAGAETLNAVAATLGDHWSPVRASSGEEQRAWASDEGIVVTFTNADPVLLVSVFPPCSAG